MMKDKLFYTLSLIYLSLLVANTSWSQSRSINIPWSSYAHDSQHTAISPTASQNLGHILWRTPVDISPTYDGNDILIHYGSPLVTRSNTVIVTLKTSYSGDYQFEGIAGATGQTNWVFPSDYLVVPYYRWFPSCAPVLTPKNRIYVPGAGGTLFYCDTPDATNPSPVFQRVAFYGLTNYLSDTNDFNGSVFVCTPLTSDRYGDVFFGFYVTNLNPLSPVTLKSGIARIDPAGNGSWIPISSVDTNGTLDRVAYNSAPALSTDHRKLYVALNGGYVGTGGLAALDSRTLAPMAFTLLKDVQFPAEYSNVDGDGTASPTVGPDGDVYFGILETPAASNHGRGWLLHFDSNLASNKLAGAFGWDDTPSIVPASMVPSYHGGSPYLLLTKYNNYADPELGGDGVNRVAILDPQVSQIDPVTGTTVMKEVMTITGPTPDPDLRDALHPNAVREWCINTAAVDPATKSALVNNEDGKMYRWDLTSNSLSETNVLTPGIGEAYTPTVIGVDGTVYGINNATLYAVGH